MNSFYIYSYNFPVKNGSVSAAVIFCPSDEIDFDQLQVEMKLFYSKHYQTDRTIFIGGSDLVKYFNLLLKNKNKVFKYVPLKEESSFYDNLHFLSFNVAGLIEQVEIYGTTKFNEFVAFKKSFIHFGLQSIFINRGGIVESTSSQHHFVFPSGKHSEKFLRVGNILLFSSEIFFIAFSLLNRINRDQMKYIYCDTSSINSIALAINELLKRLDKKFKAMPINSFRSYEGIYDSEINLKSNSLILISASTSGTILESINKKQPYIKTNNIVILYFMENKEVNSTIFSNVLCDLTKRENNLLGVDSFYQEKSDRCILCEKGSHPMLISGDIFLLEKPKVNSVVISAEDMDVVNSSTFINLFMSEKATESILKVNYKEPRDEDNAHRNYEVYIDYGKVIDKINESRFAKHKQKLDSYINQYVPSNLKWIIHLQDESSSKLAHYIFDKISKNYISNRMPILLNQNDFSVIKRDLEGSVLIVGSCISNGKNLLYLSRALRNFKLRIVYFIGINRYSNINSNKFLKTNLKYGTYGADNSSFIEVEKISCTSNSINNPWQQEIEFLKPKINDTDDDRVSVFFKDRINLIEEGASVKTEGLSNKIFLPRINGKREVMELNIRRNSAFYSDENYASNVSQSDVYFNIAYVLNRLRNSDNNAHNLRQSTYVRNLISPSNLNRFNDGIIQASFIRAAKKEELNYSIDEAISQEICIILITIIRYWENEQGEALLEFLYALSSKKMTLVKSHLLELVLELEKIEHEIVSFYKDIIKNNLN